MFGQKWLNIWMVLGGLAVLGWILQAIGVIEPPRESRSNAPSVPVGPICILSAGRIVDKVQLYSDDSCTKPLGKILGIGDRDGQKMVMIQHTDGSSAWKTREAVTTQAFVRQDDPALKSP